MWDLIVSVPDHCLSFYFTSHKIKGMSSVLSGLVPYFARPSSTS